MGRFGEAEDIGWAVEPVFGGGKIRHRRGASDHRRKIEGDRAEWRCFKKLLKKSGCQPGGGGYAPPRLLCAFIFGCVPEPIRLNREQPSCQIGPTLRGRPKYAERSHLMSFRNVAHSAKDGTAVTFFQGSGLISR
jgi:hypothetical protein